LRFLVLYGSWCSASKSDEHNYIGLEKIMSVVTQQNAVVQQNEALIQQVVSAVKGYLNTMNMKDSNLNLYQLLVEEVEAPLFRTVMEMTRYNQSKAARVLGVSRGTLRTKLKRYFDDEFIGTRDV
jgi:Fis family transcriptional regulator, factor for inversion stimulation protein